MNSYPPSDSADNERSVEQQFQLEHTDIADSQVGGIAGRDINQSDGSIHQTTDQSTHQSFSSSVGNVANTNYGTQITTQHIHNAPVQQRSKELANLASMVQEQHIDWVLERSLSNLKPITLSKEHQPGKIRSPNRSWVLSGQDEVNSFPDAPISQIFNHSKGLLLILGEPGAGKTTTLLQLAQDLLHRAQQDAEYPIAVLFNLASWNPKQSIDNWLVAELESKYGQDKKLGKEWLEKHQLILLLDGLDEQSYDQQLDSIKAINKLLNSELRPRYLVVCCRSEEYDQLRKRSPHRLQLNGAVELQSLSDEQIRAYTDQFPQSKHLTDFITNQSIRDLVRTPLMLSIVCVTYKKVSIKELEKISSQSNRIQYLWNVYVEKMLDRHLNTGISSSPKRHEIRRWLTFIARNLKKEDQVDFIIEKLQIKWLERPPLEAKCKRMIMLRGAILSAFPGLIVASLLDSFQLGIVLTLMTTLCGMAYSSFDIKGYTLIDLTIARIMNRSRVIALLWIIFGKPIFYFGYVVCLGAIGAILLGGCFAVVAFIRTIVFGSLNGSAESVLSWAYQGALIGGTIVTLLGMPLFMLTLNYGGLECLKHWVLRRILFKHGYGPWDYTAFLDYATELRLVQRLGWGYRFMHTTLRDYFASLPLQFEDEKD